MNINKDNNSENVVGHLQQAGQYAVGAVAGAIGVCMGVATGVFGLALALGAINAFSSSLSAAALSYTLGIESVLGFATLGATIACAGGYGALAGVHEFATNALSAVTEFGSAIHDGVHEYIKDADKLDATGDNDNNEVSL